jgi:hypothetical protein
MNKRSFTLILFAAMMFLLGAQAVSAQWVTFLDDLSI